MLGIPRTGKTGSLKGVISVKRPDPDAYCKICKQSRGIQLCAACKIRAYCSREHQKQDWPRHKSECQSFQELEQLTKQQEQKQQSKSDKGDETTSILTSSDQAFDYEITELEKCLSLWKTFDKENTGYMPAEVADTFLEAAMAIIFDPIFDEDVLKEVFRQEFGPDVTPPPHSVFIAKKNQAKRQFCDSLWTRVEDESTMISYSDSKSGTSATTEERRERRGSRKLLSWKIFANVLKELLYQEQGEGTENYE